MTKQSPATPSIAAATLKKVGRAATAAVAAVSLSALGTADMVDSTVPAVLLRYQVESIQLSHANPLLVVEKSRRTGFTYGWAAEAVLTAAPAKGGMDVFYIAYNLDMTREFIGYCGDFAKAFNHVATVSDEFLFDDGSEEGIKAFRIDFPSGHSIVALSSKPRSLRGKQGLVIIDEAAFHDQLDELLKAALALLMWGGRVVVISTHDGADNPFNVLIEEIRAGKREGVVQRVTLSDALVDGLFKRICLRTGKPWSQEAENAWVTALLKTYGDAADEELHVIPSRGTGTYIARATVEAAMTPDFSLIRLTCPDGFERRPMEEREAFIADWIAEHLAPIVATFDPDRWSYFGQDFARTTDLSVIAGGQRDVLLNKLVRFVLEMRNVPFREQKQILDWLCANMPMFAAGKMDARGNGQQLAEDMQTDWGFDRIEAVMASPNTYLTMMPLLKAAIEDRTMLIPRHEAITDDFRLLKLVRGVPGIVDRANDKADGAKGKRHGDTVIALMNINAAMNEDVGPIEVHAVGDRRAGASDLIVTDRGFGTVARADIETMDDY